MCNFVLDKHPEMMYTKGTKDEGVTAMMMNITIDRPWNEQPEEVRNAIDEQTYNKVADILGIKLESRQKSIKKLLTNISKYGILRA